MNYIVKSAQIVTKILGAVFGNEFVSPSDQVLKDDLYLGLYW